MNEGAWSCSLRSRRSHRISPLLSFLFLAFSVYSRNSLDGNFLGRLGLVANAFLSNGSKPTRRVTRYLFSNSKTNHPNYPPNPPGGGANTGGRDDCADGSDPSSRSDILFDLFDREFDQYQCQEHVSDESIYRVMSIDRGGGDTVRNTQTSLQSKARRFLRSRKEDILSILQPEKRKERRLLERLKRIPIQNVEIVPSDTNTDEVIAVPSAVVQQIAQKSGIIGKPLQMDSVQRFAAALQNWYQRKGYLLSSVSGATLEPETQTAQIQVSTPVVDPIPIRLTVYQERPLTDGSQRMETNATASENPSGLVEVLGRTKPAKIASTLGLVPGKPFHWNEERWEYLLQRGIFSRILRTTPIQHFNDSANTVQVEIVAVEAPSRHFEYGIGKSMYTGDWEGEIEFEQKNVLGGGEDLALSVRKGAKDRQPSFNVRFSDDRMGRSRAYDVEAFWECLESTPSFTGNKATTLSRTGASLSFRKLNTVGLSSASLALEKSPEVNSRWKNLLVNLNTIFQPLIGNLPVGNGRYLCDMIGHTGVSTMETKRGIVPYHTSTVNFRQKFPLRVSGLVSQNTKRLDSSLSLFLSESATLSTSWIPHHIRLRQDVANRIRGKNRMLSSPSLVRGVAEIRIPVDVPVSTTTQDGYIALFGDMLSCSSGEKNSWKRTSSLGVAVFKSFQGIPLNGYICRGSGEWTGRVGIGQMFDF